MSNDVKDKNVSLASDEAEDKYTYKPRNRVKKQETKKKETPAGKEIKKTTEKQKSPKGKKAAIISVVSVLGVVLVLVVAAVSYTMMLPDDKIANNISIAGVDVGGMDVIDAENAISGIINEETVVGVTSKNKNAEFNAVDFSLSADLVKSVENAMKITKSGNIFVDAFYGVKLLFSQHDSGLVLNYDEEVLGELLYNFGTTINGVSSDVTFEYSENSMTIIPGIAGQSLDTKKAQSEVIEAVSSGKLAHIPVTLEYAEPAKLNSESVYEKISTEAKDAYYEKTEDGKIKIIEHSVGVVVDKNDLNSAIETVNSGGVATIDAEINMPLKTKEDLEENLFKKTIGTYTTDYSTSSSNRAFNVERAANSINGLVLMPGDEFSYNESVGNPSLKNGYKVAPIFENGKTSEGVGGGICQVSSTLYNAVLLADLDIVERHNHSLTVAYVPKGQDATVSYGALDFKFKNSTDYPVRINTSASNRKLTISIIGAPYVPERKVTIYNELVSTIPPGENITEDPLLPADTKNIVSKGKNGYVVDTYKTIYEDGVKVSSKKITTSRYRPTNAEVVVGTLPVDAPVVAPNGETIESPVEEQTPDAPEQENQETDINTNTDTKSEAEVNEPGLVRPPQNNSESDE